MVRRDNPLVRRAARACEIALKAYENLDHDFRRNGEVRILERLSAAGIGGIIMDVGANVGDYAALLARHFPSARIYSFEIVPQTYERLCCTVKSLGSVTPINMGLSSSAKTVRIKYYKEISALSTLTDYPHDAEFEWIEGHTISGAEFCRANGIEEIDFLKVDVEGHENEVLKGFEEYLKAARIKVVQFEYGYANVLSKFFSKTITSSSRRTGIESGRYTLGGWSSSAMRSPTRISGGPITWPYAMTWLPPRQCSAPKADGCRVRPAGGTSHCPRSAISFRGTRPPEKCLRAESDEDNRCDQRAAFVQRNRGAVPPGDDAIRHQNRDRSVVEF